MTFASILGLDKTAEVTVDQSHAAMNELLDRAAPMIAVIENRLGGIAHGLLDRVKVKIEIEILPIPKAELANPPR